MGALGHGQASLRGRTFPGKAGAPSQSGSLEAKSRNGCGTTANGRILCVHHAARPFFFLFFRYLFAVRSEEQERLLIRRPITRA